LVYDLTEGVSAADIAGQKTVSLSKVRAHGRSILRKLDVSSQVAAMAIANGVELRGHRHIAYTSAALATGLPKREVGPRTETNGYLNSPGT
jgi:hypothetical protein